ncbi:5-oxoprolinase subunit PxpB [Oceanobacillus neutriphilus]|uniref:Allophanate hydrolase n=1 Tax=Oceanobacillus neutriphilus TaxID=531815 RepID=A0ABQ2NQC7_9BACI|nr:5-oxoprolinase subunit PxpB [Oceanobacillus neutriphilus]GGP07178.1 allophanate hydrolase [Oceanobacillus neutriphilus]
MYSIQLYGDRGVRIQFGNKIERQVNVNVHRFTSLLEKYPMKGITEWIPAYTSVTIYYNPGEITYMELEKKLNQLQKIMSEEAPPAARKITIPVCYEKEFAVDMDDVAEYHKLSSQEIIRLHTEPLYYVYMMGFMPGFPYLGGLSEKLFTPRLDSPRKRVDRGSVGIADQQTGIYPLDSPGGWRIIGKTPARLYDAEKENKILIRSGDMLQFEAIDSEAYYKIEDAVQNGEYQPEISEEKGDPS